MSNNYISTGIENLDKLLEGGIQKGFATLILGPPGSSIEILGKQIASTQNVLYITTDETQQEVTETMSRFSWNFSDINFVDISTLFSQQIFKSRKRPSFIFGNFLEARYIFNKNKIWIELFYYNTKLG